MTPASQQATDASNQSLQTSEVSLRIMIQTAELRWSNGQRDGDSTPKQKLTTGRGRIRQSGNRPGDDSGATQFIIFSANLGGFTAWNDQ